METVKDFKIGDSVECVARLETKTARGTIRIIKAGKQGEVVGFDADVGVEILWDGREVQSLVYPYQVRRLKK